MFQSDTWKHLLLIPLQSTRHTSACNFIQSSMPDNSLLIKPMRAHFHTGGKELMKKPALIWLIIFFSIVKKQSALWSEAVRSAGGVILYLALPSYTMPYLSSYLFQRLISKLIRAQWSLEEDSPAWPRTGNWNNEVLKEGLCWINGNVQFTLL